VVGSGLGNQLQWLFSSTTYDILLVNYPWLSGLDLLPGEDDQDPRTTTASAAGAELLAAHGSREFFHLSRREESVVRADLGVGDQGATSTSAGRLPGWSCCHLVSAGASVIW